MSEEDRIWREGDPVWVWPEGESVPRYMWTQISREAIVDLLNAYCGRTPNQ